MSYFTSQELLEKGKECFKKNEFKKAESVLSELTERDSSDLELVAEAYFYLSNIIYISVSPNDKILL